MLARYLIVLLAELSSTILHTQRSIEGIYRDTITDYQIADIRFSVHEGTFVITNSRAGHYKTIALFS